MKKRFFDIQLFAEDLGTGNPTPPAVDPVTEPKPKESAPTAQPKDKGEPKYTDTDVNELINKKFAEWQKKQEKAVSEAGKLATMNATQKAEYEREQLQKELDEYKKQASLAEMSKTARKMLADDGITVSDELLAVIVTTDAQETKNTVDSFKTLFKTAVESAVKERLRGEPPKVSTGGSSALSEIDKRLQKYQ